MGCTVIVHNTSTTEKEVSTYQKMAEKHGVKFFSLVVENRHGNTNIHNVPENVLDAQEHRFSVKLR